MAAHVIDSLIKKTGLNTDEIDEVVLGCENQGGEDSRNVSRNALLLAGLPDHIAGITVNRNCASGLDAVNLGARGIKAGEMDVVIAGGVESMTRAPLVMKKPDREFVRGNQQLWDSALGWRMGNPKFPYPLEGNGETAENVAEQYEISRQEQDAYAFESQKRAAKAKENGIFEEEIVPISYIDHKKNKITHNQDEHMRPDITIENLAKLKTVFKKNGTVTAGNSSGINDGAAALLLVSAKKGRELGLKPKARILSSASAGVNPSIMGIGPVP